jgi:hypothetical protein
MTTTNAKQVALALIQQLPDDVTYEDNMYELYFREAVDEGLRQVREGKLTPSECRYARSTGVAEVHYRLRGRLDRPSLAL